MPSENLNCGVYAVRVFLSVILGKPHLPLASKMRGTLFEVLPFYLDVPIVGGMTYAQWASAHGKTAEEMMHKELTQLGLSNFLLAMVAYIHRVDCDLYSVCAGNPNYATLVQRSRVAAQSLGLMSVLYRGDNDNLEGVLDFLGHYNLIVPVGSDEIPRVHAIMSSFHDCVTPSMIARNDACTTPSSMPPRNLTSSLLPLGTPSKQHATNVDVEQDNFIGYTLSKPACSLLRSNCMDADFDITVRYRASWPRKRG